MRTVRDTRPSAEATRVDGLDTPVLVRRHPAARRMTLRVSRTKRAVVVTVPIRCNVEDAGSFVNRHLDWVRDRLCTLPEPVPFVDGAMVPIRGVFHRVLFTGERGRSEVVTLRRPQHAPVAAVHGRPSQAPRQLARWLVEAARGDLEARVAVHAARLKLTPKRIAVRDQTSRWGSCSTTGALSFSWRLVLAPPAVLDYVAAHEVAHLAEMNHGPRFWSLVRRTMPDMDGPREWLSKLGSELHRYGPSR
jgi:hypothetical protein